MTFLSRITGLLFILISCAVAQGQEPLSAGDIQMLLRGITFLNKPGIPGPIGLIDGRASTLVAARVRKKHALPLIAVARHGRGSVLVFGHGGYLTPESLNQSIQGPGRLVMNYLDWRDLGADDVIAHVNSQSLKSFFGAKGRRYTAIGRDSLWKHLKDFSVVILGQGEVRSANEAARLRAWVKSGGNLICSGLVWGWQQLNPRLDSPRDHYLNQALAPMGLFFAGGMIDSVIQPPDANLELLRSCSGSRALARLETREGQTARATGALKQAGQVVQSCVRWLPDGQEHYMKRVLRLLKQSRPDTIPTKKKPLASEHVLGRLALTVDHLLAQGLEPGKVRAAPSARDFPGQPDPLEKPITRRVKVNPELPGWKSTGLYARAGAPVSVSLPGRTMEMGLRLRIGSHSDRLWDKARWSRHPEISRSWPLSSAWGSFASPHGGLVYIEVPRRAAGKPFTVEIRGACRALHYVLGKTTSAEWQKALEEVSAPWAELECSRVILTVTRESAVAIKDPEKLMTFWNDVLPLYGDLGQRPLDRRPQRFVADRQISAGWLHSGYPIMMHMVHSDEIVNLSQLRDAPKDECFGWGFWHEMGHNHQRGAWTPRGTVEVTCNFFSLYVEDRVRGIKPVHHSWPRGARGKVQPYLLKPDFSRWKKEPGLALWTFILIQDAFGWEVFQKAFKSYEEQGQQIRRSDQWKWDQILIRFSRACQRDLGPYLAAWGIPSSPEARRLTAHLKPWFPKGLQMKGMNGKK